MPNFFYYKLGTCLILSVSINKVQNDMNKYNNK